jgi:hypothetical protein
VSIFIYADETKFQRAASKPGDLTVGYGVLAASAPVDARVTDEALAALESGPDQYRPQCKVQNDRTLARRYFRATDDSGNSHSHLCSAIRRHISGVFTYVLVDSDSSSTTLEGLSIGKRRVFRSWSFVTHPSPPNSSWKAAAR